MTDTGKVRTRAATVADAVAIAAIYNEGIADRIAAFETEPRSVAEIAGWFTGKHLVVVVETGETESTSVPESGFIGDTGNGTAAGATA